MSVEIKVPSLGESVVEATIAKWYKNEGDSVTLDEPLLELERRTGDGKASYTRIKCTFR